VRRFRSKRIDRIIISGTHAANDPRKWGCCPPCCKSFADLQWSLTCRASFRLGRWETPRTSLRWLITGPRRQIERNDSPRPPLILRFGSPNIFRGDKSSTSRFAMLGISWSGVRHLGCPPLERLDRILSTSHSYATDVYSKRSVRTAVSQFTSFRVKLPEKCSLPSYAFSYWVTSL
jgi:hypothetical protein